MNRIKKLDYLQNEHMGEWLKARQVVEDSLSERQPMFCVCGRLATGMHEMSCRKFKDRIISETIKRLKCLIPKGKDGSDGNN